MHVLALHDCKVCVGVCVGVCVCSATVLNMKAMYMMFRFQRLIPDCYLP